MRIARSTSPLRRKRLPSANCSSTVCGFSLATWRNDSIALSGWSFSMKFRPRKYELGSARDSDRSDFRSTLAATHPMPKKTGRARSHQNSNSMNVDVRRIGGRRVGVAERHRVSGLAQARDLAALPHDRGKPGEQPDHHAGDEHHQQDEHERRLPRLVRKPVQGHRLRVLDREPDQDEDDREAKKPDENLHG